MACEVKKALALGERIEEMINEELWPRKLREAETGDWIVVDMGEGECSSLPPSLEPTQFYGKLAERMGTEAADSYSINPQSRDDIRDRESRPDFAIDLSE